MRKRFREIKEVKEEYIECTIPSFRYNCSDDIDALPDMDDEGDEIDALPEEFPFESDELSDEIDALPEEFPF